MRTGSNLRSIFPIRENTRTTAVHVENLAPFRFYATKVPPHAFYASGVQLIRRKLDENNSQPPSAEQTNNSLSLWQAYQKTLEQPDTHNSLDMLIPLQSSSPTRPSSFSSVVDIAIGTAPDQTKYSFYCHHYNLFFLIYL
ncbi:hypothetical protein AVEN_21961-1 [Araneus ventricosus]|uniref:Uncharacterized protein n=1 Tax=Araneus ventricosus TaxID=182803 RepID=A0A4Y2NKF8_ARAVE|nr:hypothetical protein AVEN_21961-1 [Araneus ventricosus]